MRIYCTLLLSIVFLSFGNRASAQTWIPVGNDTKGEAVLMKVLQDDASSYQIEITINGLNDQLIEKNQERYHRLSLGKGGILLESGEPTLPTLSRLIALPTGTKAVSSVVEEEWKDIEMGTIYPGQIPPRDFKKKESFYMDKNAYSKPFIPKLVSQSEEQTWRGIGNVVVSVCPFKYYPNENRLSVLKKFILQVNFEHSSRLADDAASYEANDDYGLFDNTAYFLSNRSQNTNNKYLIICKDANIMNSQSMKEFRIWKALKGFNTQLVLLNSILSSPPTFSQDDVKAYIRNHVDSGGFVLLVGDNSKIPMAQTPSFYNNYQTIKGDYWYGCGTGTDDWEADIAVGRFSVSNLNEFARMVRKTIRYESTPPQSMNTLLMAHKEGENSVLGYQYWCEYIRTTPYIEPMSFVTAYGYEGATNADVVNYINSGVPIVCYLGYGYPNYWGGLGADSGDPNPDCSWNMDDELFYGSEVANLNDTAQAVIFSCASNTADISVSENMLEAFTRSYYGSPAFVGSAEDGSSFDYSNERFAKILFEYLLITGDYLLGDLSNKAHISNISGLYNSLQIDNTFTYVCGGDPALEFWTAFPQTFGDVNLNEDNSNVTITTQYYGDYKVSVASENGDLLGTYNVESGNTCTFPRPSVNCYIGITKHNYIPKILKYDVTTDAVQDEEITMDSYYHYTPIGFGDGVSLDISDGPVIVKNGTKLVIKNGTGGVRFIEGFECEEGAILEVK